jgi:hypothetical protein
VYALVRKRFRKFGRLGDYLTGLACMYAYLLAFGIPLAVFTREEMLRDPVGWLIMAVLGTVFGLAIGHSWFERSTIPRPRPPNKRMQLADASMLRNVR